MQKRLEINKGKEGRSRAERMESVGVLMGWYERALECGRMGGWGGFGFRREGKLRGRRVIIGEGRGLGWREGSTTCNVM